MSLDNLSKRQRNFVEFLAAVRVALFGQPPCPHQYNTIDEWNISSTSMIDFKDRVTGRLFVMRCVHCGDIKQKKVSLLKG